MLVIFALTDITAMVVKEKVVIASLILMLYAKLGSFISIRIRRKYGNCSTNHLFRLLRQNLFLSQVFV